MSNPIVTINMENGNKIVLELYPEVAPNTVKNFISLVKKGFYDGLIFHRVIADFMIQGGCPNGTGRGVISMARAANPNSAGSQFFIMHADGFFLDGQYAAFGKVIEGLDAVDAIASVDTNHADRPLVEQKIKSITVDTQGKEYGEPEIS